MITRAVTQQRKERGEPSKVKNGWRAQVAVQGVRESRHLSTKAEAVAWATARETEIRAGKATGIQAGETVGQAFDRYEKEVSARKARIPV